MSDEKKSAAPIDFSHLGGKKIGHPVADRSRKEPIDFSSIGGKRVGQAHGQIAEQETDPE